MASIANMKMGVASITIGGVDIGHTKGGAEVTISPELYEQTVDKYGASVVNVVEVGTKVELKVMVAESTKANLAKIIAGATLDEGTTKDEVTLGRSAGTTLTALPITLHPIAMGVSTEDDWTFHRCVPTGEITASYKVDEDTIYEATFMVLVDETKAEGNMLCKIGNKD